MAWTNIPTTDIDQDSPVTQPLLVAIRDNIQWAWECTWHPYDMVYPGDGNDGLLYDFDVDGNQATITTADFADGYEYRIIVEDFVSTLTGDMDILFYGETSAAYNTGQTITSLSNTLETSYVVDILKPRRVRNVHPFWATGKRSTTSIDAKLSYDSATAQKVLRARLSNGVAVAAGRVYVEKRRDGTG